jgi:hypothetical protein
MLKVKWWSNEKVPSESPIFALISESTSTILVLKKELNAEMRERR